MRRIVVAQRRSVTAPTKARGALRPRHCKNGPQEIPAFKHGASPPTGERTEGGTGERTEEPVRGLRSRGEEEMERSSCRPRIVTDTVSFILPRELMSGGCRQDGAELMTGTGYRQTPITGDRRRTERQKRRADQTDQTTDQTDRTADQTDRAADQTDRAADKTDRASDHTAQIAAPTRDLRL